MPASQVEKIKIYNISNNFIRFEISNITEGVANALRRTLINDIPKLAIDKVVFRHGQIRDSLGNVFDSSLPLFDEMVAHRIGLIPIITDSKMNFRDECTCEGRGCALCTVSYSIDKTGPGEVYSGDLVPFTGNVDLVPADPLIPIVKLGPKQALLITAEATMGTGKQHSKWQVTSGVSYKYHREFTVSKEDYKEWVSAKEKFSESVVSENGSSITFTDDFQQPGLMRFLYTCIHMSKVNETKAPAQKEDRSRFIFKFETDGSLSSRETLEIALARLPIRLTTLHESMVTPD